LNLAIDHASPTTLSRPASDNPVLCFSHLRWDFVFQRPQHIMTRLAKQRPVYFIEEPFPCEAGGDYLEYHPTDFERVTVIRPRIAGDVSGADRDARIASLIGRFCDASAIRAPILWFYTPMMTPWAGKLNAQAIVYDCMDELSHFRFAPAELVERERRLLKEADLVFTGGYSLYEAKRDLHADIHPFPSGVDAAHFRTAREKACASTDGERLPVFGFYGVLDERIDFDLLAEVARLRPHYRFEMVGPVAKIDPASLPRLNNIAYPGAASYRDLPARLATWDVALMPFALNEATRFISPTKTPEYLSGGKPVVSTRIRDVERHYGDLEGVIIADGAAEFAEACDRALALCSRTDWLEPADAQIAAGSWDKIVSAMSALVERKLVAAAAMPPLDRFPTPKRKSKPVYDYLIVGAGFAGSVLAERLAAGSGKKVLLCDKREHVGGNAYDEQDAAGILVHRYGPHIFHTNSADIFDYLSRFTKWRPYEHRVLASVDGKLLPIPINRTTLNGLYGLSLQTDADVADYLAGLAAPVDVIRNSRDVVVSQVGADLYRKFFQGYTRKQWGLDPSDLDKSVTSRIPTRTSTDDRYFLDRYQAMPLDGYTRMFENMLDHPSITIELGVSYEDVRKEHPAARTIFTGPIDQYFDYRYGPLPYRSLEFRHETHDQRQFQPVAVVNYPSEDVPHTRVTEYKHLTGQASERTSICYEYARSEGDPYYPIPRAANQALYKRYEELARALPDVSFVGRLGTYRYYNMDQVVGQALATYRKLETAAQPSELALA
jgi:UDP-galactopyranose mutase